MFYKLFFSWSGLEMEDFCSHSGRYYCLLGLIPHEKPVSDFNVVKLQARFLPYLEIKHQPKATPSPQACSIHLQYHLL